MSSSASAGRKGHLTKDNTHAFGVGMQQALGYAEALRVRFVFSSSGEGFVFHDATGQSAILEANLGLEQAVHEPQDVLYRETA